MTMNRLLAIRVITFLCLVACGAFGQQPGEKHSSNSLPDAPSADLSRIQLNEARSSLAATPMFVRQSKPSEDGQVVYTDLTDLIKLAPVEKDSHDVVEKYLHSTFLARNLGYHPSMSGNFLDRAAYAASSIFVTEDESGRRRLNTSYFAGMLGSAFIHTAYRPYWRRSASEPFSDFGSNIGSDAGMNFLHEFGPGIEQLMKSHAPKFVYKIEERIGR